MLLAPGGEDEIGMRNGKELSLGLGSLGHALAPAATRAYGDLRLDHLVARAARIGFRRDKGRKPLLLVGLEPVFPHDRHQDGGDEHKDKSMLGPHAAQN